MAQVIPASQDLAAAENRQLEVKEVSAQALDERGRAIIGLPLELMAIGKELPVEMLLPRMNERGDLEFLRLSAAGQIPDLELVRRLVQAGMDRAYFHRSGLVSFSDFLEAETARLVLNRKVPPQTKARFVYESARLAVTEAQDPELLPGAVYRLVGVADRFCRILPRHSGVIQATVRRLRINYSLETHAVNVGMLAMALGMRLRLNREDLLGLGLGALLHDLGKSSLDHRILEKVGPLNAKEWQQMRMHPKLGYDQLAPLGSLPDEALEVVLSHHENLDGTGYPWGIKGKELGLATRIVRVVDSYDAITSNRVYATASQSRQAVRIIIKEMRGLVDERVLRNLVELLASLSRDSEE